MWTDRGKIAATGVRATRWISYHGFALNVCPDLAHFDHIVPCGIADRDVTSVKEHLCTSGDNVLGEDEQALLAQYSAGIQAAFAGVFGVDLYIGDTSVLTGDALDCSMTVPGAL